MLHCPIATAYSQLPPLTSPTAMRGNVVGRYASPSPPEPIVWSHVGVGVVSGFLLACVLAVATNWWVNRNQRTDLGSWRDEFEDDH